MRREVPVSDLEKKYTANDMAKIGCGGCAGCWDCCQGMGESVVLDPLDVHRLCEGLESGFAALMERYLEFNVVDKVILPNLRMDGEEERCGFLNEEKRCRIHSFRPGVCRLFPLGRLYENGTFSYFVQGKECKMEPKTKVKISKWLDTPELKKYEAYILRWHGFLEAVRRFLEREQDEALPRDLNTYLVENFFARPYTKGNFYAEFEERLAQTEKLMKIMQNSGA